LKSTYLVWTESIKLGQTDAIMLKEEYKMSSVTMEMEKEAKTVAEQHVRSLLDGAVCKIHSTCSSPSATNGVEMGERAPSMRNVMMITTLTETVAPTTVDLKKDSTVPLKTQLLVSVTKFSAETVFEKVLKNVTTQVQTSMDVQMTAEFSALGTALMESVVSKRDVETAI